MVRLYTLLSIIPHLPLPFPYAHAALLPRVNVPSEPPGVVSTAPSAKPAIKVVPFIEPRHGFPKLHRTLSVVKRLVEENGYMVEVSEEALQDVLDQINKLQDQVSSMFSPDSRNKGSSQPGVGQPGRESGQLPSGSFDTPSNENLPAELPAQPNRTGLPNSGEIPGPSQVPIVSEPSLRSNLPGQPNIPNTVVQPLPSSSFNSPSVPGQPGPAGQGQPSDQADAVASELPGNSDGEPASLPTELPGEDSNNDSTGSTETRPSGIESAQQPKESLPEQPGEESVEPKSPSEKQAEAQPNGQIASLLGEQPTGQLAEPAAQTANQQGQGQTELHSGTVAGTQPTGSPNNVPGGHISALPDEQVKGEPSGLPGGVFVEDPDNVPGSGPYETTSIGQAQIQETEGGQQPSQTIDPNYLDEDEVSGQPNVHQNINYAPGIRSSATEPGRASSTITTHGSTTRIAPNIQTEVGTQSTLGIQTAINAEVTLESPTALESPAAQDFKATLDIQTAFDTQTTLDLLATLDSQETLKSEATLGIEAAFNTQTASEVQTAPDASMTLSIQAQLDTRTTFDTQTAPDTQATLDAQAAPDTQTVSGPGGTEALQQTTGQPATTDAASSIENSEVSASTKSPATLTTPMAVQQTLTQDTTTRETQQLRTLVFTSVLTRSSRVKWTTTRTEFFHISQPTGSPTIPGLVFKEDPDMTLLGDEGPTVASESSGSSTDESISQKTAPSTVEASGSTSFQETSFQESGLDATATLLLTESIITRTPITSMDWSDGSTPATEAPKSSTRPLLPPNAAAANTTYTTPASGFRTMAKQTRSLMERAEMM
ncbi:hypothetical protein CEP54_003525 [Fusarium duplospermum]|uniref:Uncharacterized protein n=1 Tax=Fusarium duplospermum TaxID=1325734 RepID=A0A428QNY2_9HYPO|nr:hypothetical protein CEP54_003525 [Fusarium duplospermum]